MGIAGVAGRCVLVASALGFIVPPAVASPPCVDRQGQVRLAQKIGANHISFCIAAKKPSCWQLNTTTGKFRRRTVPKRVASATLPASRTKPSFEVKSGDEVVLCPRGRSRKCRRLKLPNDNATSWTLGAKGKRFYVLTRTDQHSSLVAYDTRTLKMVGRAPVGDMSGWTSSADGRTFYYFNSDRVTVYSSRRLKKLRTHRLKGFKNPDGQTSGHWEIQWLGKSRALLTMTPCAGPCSSGWIVHARNLKRIVTVGGRKKPLVGSLTAYRMGKRRWAFVDALNGQAVVHNSNTGRLLRRFKTGTPDGIGGLVFVLGNSTLASIGNDSDHTGDVVVVPRKGKRRVYKLPDCPAPAAPKTIRPKG